MRQSGKNSQVRGLGLWKLLLIPITLALSGCNPFSEHYQAFTVLQGKKKTYELNIEDLAVIPRVPLEVQLQQEVNNYVSKGYLLLGRSHFTSSRQRDRIQACGLGGSLGAELILYMEDERSSGQHPDNPDDNTYAYEVAYLVRNDSNLPKIVSSRPPVFIREKK